MCKQSGGKREGSGRKKGPETVTINFRVPKEYSGYLKVITRDFIKQAISERYSKLI